MIRETLALSAKLVGFLMVGFFIPATALANEDLDVTMRMVTDDAELTDSVVREIESPALSKDPKIQANLAPGVWMRRVKPEKGGESSVSPCPKRPGNPEN